MSDVHVDVKRLAFGECRGLDFPGTIKSEANSTLSDLAKDRRVTLPSRKIERERDREMTLGR